MPLAMLDHQQIRSTATDLTVTQETDPQFMAELQNRTPDVMQNRFADGHRAYIAYDQGEPAGWGWVATRVAEIGELATRFDIPRGHRYLWNFVTLPHHRGKGIYPRLLQSILQTEAAHAETFWIAYAPENRASASGIHKAGFTTVATLSFDGRGRPAAHAVVPGGDLRAAELLGIAVSNSALSQCWRCVRAAAGMPSCRTSVCGCDYQRPQVSCA